jgi:hypothetical protein
MDIDIDIDPSVDIAAIFPEFVRGSRVDDNNDLKAHPCGWYYQNIPVDPLTNIAAIPFEQAEQMGYTKIDFLHLSLLTQFKSKQQIIELATTEPNWDILQDPQVVEQLFQLRNSWKYISAIKPRSIEELADTIAIIRPDKRNLLQAYLRDRVRTRPKLYRKNADDKSSFRRSHAIAYAHTVVMQINSITPAQRSSERLEL